jgi:hypothetical protein
LLIRATAHPVHHPGRPAPEAARSLWHQGSSDGGSATPSPSSPSSPWSPSAGMR